MTGRDKRNHAARTAFLGVLLLLLAPGIAMARQVHILAIGDSLMAGYGLMESDSPTGQLETLLKAKGHDVVIENAGVSGDTTRMGLDRIDWLLSGEKPDMAILELGANDALRGVPPEETRKNLTAMIEKLKAKDIPTLLAGMKAPRNMGKGYVAKFDPIYPELAKKYDLAFYPFFMEDVIDNPHLLQYDGRHPTYQGVKVIVDKMLPVVEPMVARLEKTLPPPEAN